MNGVTSDVFAPVVDLGILQEAAGGCSASWVTRQDMTRSYCSMLIKLNPTQRVGEGAEVAPPSRKDDIINI